MLEVLPDEVARLSAWSSVRGKALPERRGTRDAPFVLMAPSAAHLPPGWQVNPSARSRRAPLVAFGLAGLALSVVGALRSAATTDQVRDAIGFSAVALTAALGKSDRWRTRPALVLAFGVAVATTAASAIAHWSIEYALAGTTSATFVFTTAFAVMPLPFAADEVYAAVTRAYEDVGARSSVFSGRHGARPTDTAAYVAGAGAIVVGMWLLLVPGFVGSQAGMHARVIGAPVIAIGALTLARVTRACRWGNAVIGAWLLAAPLLYGYQLRGAIQAIIAGISLLMVSVALADPEPSACEGVDVEARLHACEDERADRWIRHCARRGFVHEDEHGRIGADDRREGDLARHA